jgi:hypothetical protein
VQTERHGFGHTRRDDLKRRTEPTGLAVPANRWPECCAVFRGVIFVLRSRDYRRIFEQLDELRRGANIPETVPITART